MVVWDLGGEVREMELSVDETAAFIDARKDCEWSLVRISICEYLTRQFKGHFGKIMLLRPLWTHASRRV